MFRSAAIVGKAVEVIVPSAAWAKHMTQIETMIIQKRQSFGGLSILESAGTDGVSRGVSAVLLADVTCAMPSLDLCSVIW